MLRIAAFMSMVSVSMNTPVTFKHFESLMYLTFVMDLVIMALFTAEMVAKMHNRGIWKVKIIITSTMPSCSGNRRPQTNRTFYT